MQSTPTPAGEPAGPSRSNAGPSTPRAPTDQSSNPPPNKKKGKPRDERDFGNANSVRGMIQGLEASRDTDRTNARKDMAELMAMITTLSNTVTDLSNSVANQHNRLADIELSNQARPSIELSPSRNPSESPPPPPRGPGPRPIPSLQPHRYRTTPEPSPTPTIQAVKSKLTEKIEPLGDGTDPTFRQWRISIRDRFVVNADHYGTEITRKALIWSTTTGLARSYLEPRYQSDRHDYATADEMIDTLESYFTTGYEKEEYRNQFHDMTMGEKGHANETFSEFNARFRSMAVLGEVLEDDWFYQMWDKITPQLREESTASKHLWHADFRQMVTSLTSIDLERRRNFDRKPSSFRNTPSGAKATAVSSAATPRSTPKPFRPFTSSGPATAPKTTVERPRFSTTPIRPPTKSTPPNTCFLCGKTGHFKKDCPELPKLRTMIQEIDETPEHDDDDQEMEDDSESVREGNEQA
jgi:hypothetical protein